MPSTLYPLPASLDDVPARADAIVEAQREALRAILAMPMWQRPKRYDMATGGDVVDYPKLQTVDEVSAELRSLIAKSDAFEASPRGRFLSVIRELIGLGEPQGVRLRGYYDRSITTLNGETADVAAITACIRILNEIGTSVARDGVAALVDLLDEQAPAQRKAA